MQVNGYFSAERDGTRDVNLAGAQLGLSQFKVIKDHVEKRNLIEQVATVGKAMTDSLTKSAERSSRITGVRGVGTSLWIDTGDYKTTMELYEHMRDNGVLVKLNGARGVMTKPALTLDESQIEPLTTALAKF